MSSKKLLLLGFALVLLLSANVMAQDDKFGAVDTIYVESYPIDAKNYAVNVSLFNDEEIMALSIPLKFTAGKTRLLADSVVYTGSLVESFRVKQARVDTTAQCLTIGLINDVGVSVPPIPPGKGRIVTIFVSSPDGAEITDFKVDSTTTYPGNKLQLVHPPSTGIDPAFVNKYVDAPKKKGE